MDNSRGNEKRQEKGKKGVDTTTSQSATSKGWFLHNRFTPSGSSDQSRFQNFLGTGSKDKLATMRRALDTINPTTEEEAGPSTSLPERSLTRGEQKDIYRLKHALKEKLLRMDTFIQQALKDEQSKDMLEDIPGFSSDMRSFLGTSTKASNYIKDGKIDCDLQALHQDLTNAIQAIEKYELQILPNPERDALLDKARPEIQPQSEVAQALDTIQAYLGNGANKPSERQYVTAVEHALKRLSPETWDEYQRRGVTFAIDQRLDYPKAQLKSDRWEFNVPNEYSYPAGMMLRCIDGNLTVDLKHTEHVTADPEGRATIAARAFLTRMKLGKRCGWNSEHYELAKQYEKDYYHGIRRAFADKRINIATPEDTLIQIGNEYAYQRLRERIKPPSGVPDIFLSTLPGSYFEEYERFQRMDRKIKLERPLQLASEPTNLSSVEIQDDGQTLFVKGPVKAGTDDWDIMMAFLEARKEDAKATGKSKSGTKFKTDSTLKVAIMQDKEIWALPYHLSMGANGKQEKTQHSIAAQGNPCVWAGEVDATSTQLIDMRGDSGHFRTYGIGSRQNEIFQFALLAFQTKGYNTVGIQDNSKVGRGKPTRSGTGFSSMSSTSTTSKPTRSGTGFSSMSSTSTTSKPTRSGTGFSSMSSTSTTSKPTRSGNVF
jgi:hypothetical protein